MELTKTQKQLIALLKALKMTESQVVGVMLALNKESQQNELIDYIIDEKDSINDELVLNKMVQLINN